MNAKNRAKLRKERTRNDRTIRSAIALDGAARNPYLKGRYGGFDVAARSAILITPAGTKIKGTAIRSRTLGKRFTVQRTGRKPKAIG